MENSKIYRNTAPNIEITAVGINTIDSKEEAMFILNDKIYFTTSLDNLKIISDFIVPSEKEVRSEKITINIITHKIVEHACYIELKDGSVTAIVDNKEVKITNSLYDSFRLMAFIRSLILETV